jgi:hypothetical protein
MSSSLTLTSVVWFIVCDGGPAVHFAAFATTLFTKHQVKIGIYATGPALIKMQDLHLPQSIQLLPFIIEDINSKQQEELAVQLINSCLKQGAQTIITDIGNKFDAVLHTASSKLNLSADTVRVWCYYDNPEPYVPGGYSIKSEETIKASKHILFANLNLAKDNSNIYSLPQKKIDLSNKTIQGIGYYPVTETEKLVQQRRFERDALRASNDWSNIKHLSVYFGGNNDAYFDEAFPTFLSSLSQLNQSSVENMIFLLHQHPAAKKENRDGLLLQEWLLKNSHIQISISTLKTSDQAQIVADIALYYQTSMAPQFILLGLPTIQIGHEIYHDILVKYNLCYTATNASQLALGLKTIKEKGESSVDIQQQKQLVYDAIGYTSDWTSNLYRIIFQ